MEAADSKKQEQFCITNTFNFTEYIYKDVFPYSPGNNSGQIMKSWAETAIAAAVLLTPIALLALWFYIDVGYQYLQGLYALIPAIVVVVTLFTGIRRLKNGNRIDWNRNDRRKTLEGDISRLQKGLPLVFDAENAKFTRLLSGADKMEYQTFPDEYDPTREYEFSARICDDGIYVGKSNRKVVSNFQQDVIETYQSDSYYGIRCRGGEDIIFDKNAFGRYKLWMVDEFVNMKRKGQQISLADYQERLKEKAE